MKSSQYWDKEVPKIVELLKQGKGIVEISKGYPVTFQRVAQACQNRGVSIRDIGLERFDRIRQERYQKTLAQRVHAKEQKRIAWFKKYECIKDLKIRKREGELAPTKGVDSLTLSRRKATRDYNQRNLTKVLCRRLVRQATIKGWIIPGVCSCGSTSVEAHHEDHNYPFRITWVCKKCHDKLTWSKNVDA